MKERPILFSGPMVRALLEGRKTQTRRVVKLCGVDGVQKDHNEWRFCEFHDNPRRAVFQGRDVLRRIITETCPYSIAGDRLWVRETWGIADSGGRLLDPCLNYRADGAQKPLIDRLDIGWSPNPTTGTGATSEQLLAVKDGWRSSRFMFRWASRITLEITDVRVQRVREISYEDAKAEGCNPPEVRQFALFGADAAGRKRIYDIHAELGFRPLWDAINAKRGFGWDVNPWVWALTFKRVTA